MRYRVAIPKAYVDEYTSGECGTCCPFLHADGYCELGVEIKKDGVCSPGPRCVPGEYKLVPADAFIALQDEVARLRAALRSITECNGAFEAMKKTAIDALAGKGATHAEES